MMNLANLTAAQLADIYVALLGLAVLMYAILDGYDLGIGVLLPGDNSGNADDNNENESDNEKIRDNMIAAIGPYWDANETWLVLAVGLLLIAFPSAHSMVLQALYLPATLMLLGLILRGVAFDFRAKAKPIRKQLWDRAFKYGSLLTTLTQGYMLGIFVTGLRTDVWAQLFALLAALGVTAAYTFIGSCWLILKTHHEVQQRAYVWAKTTLFILALGLVAVSAANLSLHDFVQQIWFSKPLGYGLVLIPFMCFSLLVLCWFLLKVLPGANGKGEWLPFFIAVQVFVLSFVALGISYYPYIIPGQVTIAEALSAPESLQFLLTGVVIVVPCILFYTFAVYRIFSGKATNLSYY